jgi:hypothetical protein
MQQQSPLFSLPRELRDSIYEFYAFEDDGCHYEFPARKLRLVSDRTLNLLYTCKAAAAELPSVLLRANKIIFTPAYSDPTRCHDGGYRGLRSQAGRFECLLHYSRWTKLSMLGNAACCITPEIIEEVMKRYPGVDGIFQTAFNAIRRSRHTFWRNYVSPNESHDENFASFCDAVQYALELASTHPGFEGLIAKACGMPHIDLGRSPFVKGSHWKVLNWKPTLWSMPSEAELALLENLLAEPGSYGDFSAGFPEVKAVDFDCSVEYRRVRWYFSATAVAIDFLGRLTPEERIRLRCLVLDENRRGVANPECHAEGLIPFCRENKSLRITMLASIWTNMAPSIWLGKPYNEARAGYSSPRLESYLCTTIDWITRTAMLCPRGMPPHAFTILLEGSLQETVQVWKLLKHVAAIKEAALDCARQRNQKMIDPYDRFDRLYEFAWYLPSNYPSTIRDIVQGTSVIQFDGVPGELWDREGMAEARLYWSWDDWVYDYSRLNNQYIRVPGGSCSYFDLYRRGVEEQGRHAREGRMSITPIISLRPSYSSR